MDIDTIGQHLYPLTTNICILEALAGVRVGTANMHKTISRHFVGTVRGAHGDPYTWLKAWDRFVKQARALDARYNLESWRDWLAFGFGSFPAYATTAALLRRRYGDRVVEIAAHGRGLSERVARARAERAP